MTDDIHIPQEPEHGKEKLYRVLFTVAGMAPRHIIAGSVEAVRTQLAAEKVDPETIAEIRFLETYYPADYRTVGVYGPPHDDDWDL